MFIQLIQQFYARVDRIIRFEAAHNENQLRKPFEYLLDQYARSKKPFGGARSRILDQQRAQSLS